VEGIYRYLAALRNLALALLIIIVTTAALNFPYDVDAPLSQQDLETARSYYADAYRKPAIKNEAATEFETKYVSVARAAAETFRIEEHVRQFVERFNLRERPVLEIGSGRGYLQDLARDYTGLDISPTVARFYHKKFVLGSATAMPFPDNSFDGAWSIWVFEHVPNPEQAFREARRVTRDNGVLFLLVAWNCTSWAAEGYEVRPYSDFGLGGKFIKASIPLRSWPLFGAMSVIPNRLLRDFVSQSEPTKLRYRRLTPNYEKYWAPDSDAVNSIDRHEAMLWFRSRGDECLNCEDSSGSVFMSAMPNFMPLIIRIHKSPMPR
jgi:SAM-dependent methyltransferase